MEDGWLPGFMYRKKIPFSYRIRGATEKEGSTFLNLVVHKAAGSDDTGWIYLNNKSRD
jgi:hypothetical protein